MTTALDLSQQQWSSYSLATIPTIEADLLRWQRGRQLAGDLANLLREHFGATRVAVFGSLNSPDWFNAYSDLDLVVWGIPQPQFYRAVAMVTAVSDEFEVDLVDGDSPPPHLIKVISLCDRSLKKKTDRDK